VCSFNFLHTFNHQKPFKILFASPDGGSFDSTTESVLAQAHTLSKENRTLRQSLKQMPALEAEIAVRGARILSLERSLAKLRGGADPTPAAVCNRSGNKLNDSTGHTQHADQGRKFPWALLRRSRPSRYASTLLSISIL
jgi:hypothetical protein